MTFSPSIGNTAAAFALQLWLQSALLLGIGWLAARALRRRGAVAQLYVLRASLAACVLGALLPLGGVSLWRAPWVVSLPAFSNAPRIVSSENRRIDFASPLASSDAASTRIAGNSAPSRAEVSALPQRANAKRDSFYVASTRNNENPASSRAGVSALPKDAVPKPDSFANASTRDGKGFGASRAKASAASPVPQSSISQNAMPQGAVAKTGAGVATQRTDVAAQHRAAPDVARTSATLSTARTASRLAPRGAAQFAFAMERVAPALVATWLLGSGALLAWMLWGWARVTLLRRRSEPVTDDALRETLRLLCADANGRAPLLLQSREVDAPILCGLSHPAIVLPLDATNWNDAMKRAVLIHETTHWRRRDLWWSTATRVLCAALWPQPLLWAVVRSAENAAEEICDAAVVQGGVEPREYSRGLLALAQQRARGGLKSTMGLGVVASRFALSRRIARILSWSHQEGEPMKIAFSLRGVIALGAVGAAVAASSLFAVRAPLPVAVASVPLPVAPNRASPAATLRSFAAALTRADLTAAASHVVGGQLPGSARTIEAAIREGGTQYSVYGEPEIEASGDSARALFFFTISRPPNKTSLSARAVLQRENGVWKIDAARTFREINGVSQWTAFLSALTGRPLREVAEAPLPFSNSSNQRIATQMRMMMVLGEAAMSRAYDRGKFDLSEGDVRRALRPYFPPLDSVLAMDASTRIGFNEALRKVSPRAAQRSPLVMFYLGRNRRLDFDALDSTLIAYTGGNTRRVSRRDARFLEWSPGASQRAAQHYAKDLAFLKAWAAKRGQAVVMGRVRYEDGRPAANVPVNLLRRSFDEKNPRSISPIDEKLWKLPWSIYPKDILSMMQAGVRTRADGTFRATGLTSGVYDIYLSSGGIYVTHDLKPRVPEWVVTRNQIVTAQEKKTVRAPDLVFTRGALIDARVVDAQSGEPLRGGVGFSTVPLDLHSNSRWFLLDDAGRAQLRAPTGDVEIFFVASGDGPVPNEFLQNRYQTERGVYDLSKTIIEVDGRVRAHAKPVSVPLQIVRGQSHRVTFRLRQYVAPPALAANAPGVASTRNAP